MTNKQAGTMEIRQALKNIFAEQLEHLPSYLEELTPREKLEFLIKLIPFMVPRVKDVYPTAGENPWEV